MSSKVVIVPCEDYDVERVYHALSTGISAMGGIEQYVSVSDKVLVKTNYLLVSDKNSGAVTHPSVTSGLLRILSEHGYGDVSYGDSPGHGTSKAASEKLGLAEGNTYGAKVAPMNEEVTVSFPEGKVCKEFHFTKDIVEADSIINLCKMKTHALMRVTGAVKNVYGFICGYRKAAGHVKYPNSYVFAQMLADIHRCRRPKLNIMDAVVAMEGNGPSSGHTVPMKVLLFSTDPVALDSVFCRMVDLYPTLVPTCVQGEKLGIGTYHYENIQVILAEGEDTREISMDEAFERFGAPDFDVERSKPKATLLTNTLNMINRVKNRPYIDKSACIKCGVCVSHCPVEGKAVDFRNGRQNAPVYDYKKCIRCFCCQEMCPQHAIHVKGRKEKKTISGS